MTQPQPFVTEQVRYKNKKFNLIQESHVKGGSKSRGLIAFIKNYIDYEEFVYAGPAIGYAQYALAYCCNQLGKKAIIFLSAGNSYETIPTKNAKKYGATVYKLPKKLSDVQSEAKQYCDEDPNKRFLCPFGLDTEEFIQIMVEEFQRANPPSIENGRIWVTVGSGTILKVLLRIYPNATFMCVRVGKNIWEDQFHPTEWSRMTIYTSSLGFSQNVKRHDIPPYTSVLNYDAKLWYFVKEHGEQGDYIFNIAGDRN